MILIHNKMINDPLLKLEVEHEFPGIGRRKMILNARKVKHHGDVEIWPQEFILLAMEDITER